MAQKRLYLAGGVGLLACLGLASVISEPRGVRAQVLTEPTSRRDVQRTLAAAGILDAKIKIQISSPVVGRIERLYVREGEYVRAGQRLVDLEKAAFLAQREGARAQVEIARAFLAQSDIDLQEARLRRERLQRLSLEHIASDEQRESAELHERSAEIAVHAAQERLRQAEAELARSEEDLSRSTLWSPLTGCVTHLAARPGEVVVSGTLNNPASVIGTVADTSDLIVEAAVDETEIADVRTSQTARVRVDALADESFSGRVVEIGSAMTGRGPGLDAATFPVRIALDRQNPAMRPGMSARVKIVTAAAKDALTIPVQAVITAKADSRSAERRESGESEPRSVFVWENGKVNKRQVRTGISDPTRIEILDGLREGERVVTGPYPVFQSLKSGDRVQTDSTNISRDPSGPGENAKAFR